MYMLMERERDRDSCDTTTDATTFPCLCQVIYTSLNHCNSALVDGRTAYSVESKQNPVILLDGLALSTSFWRANKGSQAMLSSNGKVANVIQSQILP